MHSLLPLLRAEEAARLPALSGPNVGRSARSPNESRARRAELKYYYSGSPAESPSRALTTSSRAERPRPPPSDELSADRLLVPRLDMSSLHQALQLQQPEFPPTPPADPYSLRKPLHLHSTSQDTLFDGDYFALKHEAALLAATSELAHAGPASRSQSRSVTHSHSAPTLPGAGGVAAWSSLTPPVRRQLEAEVAQVQQRYSGKNRLSSHPVKTSPGPAHKPKRAAKTKTGPADQAEHVYEYLRLVQGLRASSLRPLSQLRRQHEQQQREASEYHPVRHTEPLELRSATLGSRIQRTTQALGLTLDVALEPPQSRAGAHSPQSRGGKDSDRFSESAEANAEATDHETTEGDSEWPFPIGWLTEHQAQATRSEFLSWQARRLQREDAMRTLYEQEVHRGKIRDMQMEALKQAYRRERAVIHRLRRSEAEQGTSDSSGDKEAAEEAVMRRAYQPLALRVAQETQRLEGLETQEEKQKESAIEQKTQSRPNALRPSRQRRPLPRSKIAPPSGQAIIDDEEDSDTDTGSAAGQAVPESEAKFVSRVLQFIERQTQSPLHKRAMRHDRDRERTPIQSERPHNIANLA